MYKGMEAETHVHINRRNTLLSVEQSIAFPNILHKPPEEGQSLEKATNRKLWILLTKI